MRGRAWHVYCYMLSKGPEQEVTVAREPEPSDSILEGIVTAIAIGLLLFTSMLSGPYLFLVPVVSIALIIIYLIIKLRRRVNP